MPYKIFAEGGKFCVYKHDAGGNKVGKSFGCHPSKKNAGAQLRALYASETKELLSAAGLETGIKAFERAGERLMITWTSNAFEDREKEIFKTKAWEDYVARHDDSGSYGPVVFWHVKGTEFADVVWSNVVGRVLVEVSRFRNTSFADKMFHAITHPEQFHDILPLGWGTSHGYAYRLGDKQNGVYDFVEKFETTVLPYHRASNLWGGIKEVIDMARTKEKDAALAELVGQEEADKQLKGAEKATSVLEQAGISFKEDDETEAEEAQDNENPDESAEEGVC